MTIKHYGVSHTKLVVNHDTSEAYLEFNTTIGRLCIPVELPGAAEVNATRGVCEQYLVLKFGLAATRVFMQAHEDGFWQQFLLPGPVGHRQLSRERLLEAYND